MFAIDDGEREEDSSYEEWMVAHAPQLKAIGLPEQLWARLHHKMLNEVFDAGAAFFFQVDKDAVDRSLKWSVHSATDIQEAGDVWLIDHAWEFDSCRDARLQLLRDPGVRARIASLLELDAEGVAAPDTVRETTSGGGDGRQDGDDAFAALLFSEVARLAHPFVVEGAVRHCVLDELGSRIQQADDSGFSCQVFADLVRGEFISLLWPARAISAGSEVTKPTQKSLEVMEEGMRYWDQRFKEEKRFDWFCRSGEITETLSRYCSTEDRVLVAGCGNSTLSFDLDAAGFHNLISTDFSQVAVDNMHALYPHLEYDHEDCTSMDGQADGSLNAIVDKGLLDSLLQKPCVDRVDESDTWLLRDGCTQDADAMRYLRQVHRSLMPNGVFILVSLGSKTNRVPFFEPRPSTPASRLLRNQGTEPSDSLVADAEVSPSSSDITDERERQILWEVLEIGKIGQSEGTLASGNDHGTQVNVYVVAKR